MLQLSLAIPTKLSEACETRELFASLALLTHVSNREGPKSNLDDSWTNHLWAAQQLFMYYGPNCIHAANKLEGGVMRHTFGNGFFLALAKRKAWNVDVRLFRSLKSIAWTRIVLEYGGLPGLLEEADKALAQQADASRLTELLAQLRDLQRKSADLFPDTRPTRLKATAMQSLDPTIEEHVVMAESTVFPALFSPITESGGADAHKIVYSTMLSLVSLCTMLRIWHFRSETVASPSFQEGIERKVFSLAQDLCNVALSLTQVDKVVYLSILRLCFTLARNVLEQQNAWPEMGWGETCLIANQLRMDRVRRNCAPTLCKVEDITSGIAEAGRYKCRFNPHAFIVRAALTPTMPLSR